MSVLLDFKTGMQTVYIPQLQTCSQETFESQGLSLSQYLDTLFEPGYATDYKGISSPSFDKGITYHKFHVEPTDSPFNMYFRTKDLKMGWY